MELAEELGRWRRSGAPTLPSRCWCGARASPSAADGGGQARALHGARDGAARARGGVRRRHDLPVGDGKPADATFALEVNEWGGVSEPRLVLRHAQPAQVARRSRCLPSRSWSSSPEGDRDAARSAVCIDAGEVWRGRLPPSRQACPLSLDATGPLPLREWPRHRISRAAVKEPVAAAGRARAAAARRPVRDRLRARGGLGRADRPRARGGGVRVRVRAPCRAAAQVGRGLHRAPGRGGENLRGDAPRHETLCAALLHDTVEDTSASIEEVRERFGEEIASDRRRRHEADGHHVPLARRGAGGELPQDDGRDGHRHAGHPDQARRPPAQHAHDRGDAQAEADREGTRDPRDLRADRAPAGDPRDQVGARGPRVRHAAPAQVPGDQGPRRPAARRPRALRQRGRRVPDGRAAPGSGSKRRSRAAPSTSTRSTRR